MSKSMTPQSVRDNFVQNLAENAYLNMCTTEEMNVVISALEKQIPKKPIFDEDKELYACPICKELYAYAPDDFCDFCESCGQAIDNSLDWSDEE